MTICVVQSCFAGYATTPAKDHVNTVIPAAFKITQCPAKVAAGARKGRGGCPGGAATTGAIYATADRRNVLSRSLGR